MSTEDAEYHKAHPEATLTNAQERMEELSRNEDNGPKPRESNQLVFTQAVTGDRSLDATNGVNTGNLNQVFALRDEDPHKSSGAAGVEGFQAPELAGESTLHITNQSPPPLSNESADGPANNFRFQATTSPLHSSDGFGVSQMQQPLSSMTLQVSLGGSSTVTPPQPPSITTSEWTAQDFTIEGTVPLGDSSTAALPLPPSLTTSEWVARDFYMQQTVEQSGFQIDDARFQELLNQASPLFSEMPAPLLLPHLQYNQRGLMEANLGITLPLNVQGAVLPPTVVAPAHDNIQGIEGTEVHSASQYHEVSLSGQKRKFPWEEDILLTPSPQSRITVSHASSNRNKNFNLATHMLHAPAYQYPNSNNRVTQTSCQVLGNQSSRLVHQVSAQSWATQNRNCNLAPQAASIRAPQNQDRHSHPASQIFFYALGHSNEHSTPAHPAVRPPCNMSYSSIYQQMGLSPDPFMRIYMLNQGSNGHGTRPNNGRNIREHQLIYDS